jgi:hypothetical protein
MAFARGHRETGYSPLLIRALASLLPSTIRERCRRFADVAPGGEIALPGV